MKATITIEDREDGGLQVTSATHPGLILSGRDRLKVMAAVLPSIDALHDRVLAPRRVQECDHDGYAFDKHGRCCPLCGMLMIDWGD